MNPLRRLLSIFPQPLHTFMAQGRFYVYISVGPPLEIRQPFHDSIFDTRQIRQPLQGRRISRVPKTTHFNNCANSWKQQLDAKSLKLAMGVTGSSSANLGSTTNRRHDGKLLVGSFRSFRSSTIRHLFGYLVILSSTTIGHLGHLGNLFGCF